MIYCLSLKNGRLSDEVDELLFWLAHRMMQERKEYLFEKNDLFRAEIRTEFKQTSFGTVFGTIFNGEVEHDGKEVSITYIVNPNKPPKNEKLQFFDYYFSDEELKAHLN